MKFDTVQRDLTQDHLIHIYLGYVHETDQDMKNKSLLETNVYRKPHEGLGEYTSKHLKDLFDCQIHKGWYSCDEGYGKVGLGNDKV